MKRLVILGAGGHAKVVADLAMKCGYTEIAFLDDADMHECMGFPVLGKLEEAQRFNDGNTEFIAAIGNNHIRKRIAEEMSLPWAILIHPSVQIGWGVSIGRGTVVMANAVVNACAQIGRHCIVNTASVVEHDNILGDYVHISPRAALGGTVLVGEEVHVGIGASVKNNITICSGCTIGAGAVVVKNLEESGIYVGVPARKRK